MDGALIEEEEKIVGRLLMAVHAYMYIYISPMDEVCLILGSIIICLGNSIGIAKPLFILIICERRI